MPIVFVVFVFLLFISLVWYFCCCIRLCYVSQRANDYLTSIFERVFIFAVPPSIVYTRLKNTILTHPNLHNPTGILGVCDVTATLLYKKYSFARVCTNKIFVQKHQRRRRRRQRVYSICYCLYCMFNYCFS